MQLRSRWRAEGIGALLLAALVVLTGCVAIPTTGSVSVGETLAEQSSDDFEFLPFGPVKGASQKEILQGFVAAFTGSAGDYEVARQFLSAGFSGDWNPRSNVTVRTGVERFTPVENDAMEYSISASSTVDETGAYRQNNTPVPQTLPFSFVQEKGEWRISKASDGIVLSDATFRQIFDKHALYFLDPTNENLVPDLRWFPEGTATIRIVSALLAGPPQWLQGAVRTAFPDGTQLAAPSVDVQSGVAIVDLSPEALAADVGERQLMQVQLTASLVNVPNIRRVSISVSGAPLSIPELGASAPQANPQVDARLVVLKAGKFGYLARNEITTIGQLSGKVVEAEPRGATVGHDQDAAAVLGAHGVSIVRSGDAETTLLDTRADLVSPSLDNYGYAWVASRSNPTSVRAYSYAGASVDVATGLTADTEIVSAEVSRDGARIAILLSTSTGPRIVVKAINRDANAAQVPTSLSESVLDASTEAGAALDATWVDELSVATLSAAGQQTSVVLYEVGGERDLLGQTVAAVSLVGGNGKVGLRALSTAGTVLARSGNGWTDTGVEVSFIATQR